MTHTNDYTEFSSVEIEKTSRLSGWGWIRSPFCNPEFSKSNMFVLPTCFLTESTYKVWFIISQGSSHSSIFPVHLPHCFHESVYHLVKWTGIFFEVQISPRAQCQSYISAKIMHLLFNVMNTSKFEGSRLSWIWPSSQSLTLSLKFRGISVQGYYNVCWNTRANFDRLFFLFWQ